MLRRCQYDNYFPYYIVRYPRCQHGGLHVNNLSLELTNEKKEPLHHRFNDVVLLCMLSLVSITATVKRPPNLTQCNTKHGIVLDRYNIHYDLSTCPYSSME